MRKSFRARLLIILCVLSSNTFPYRASAQTPLKKCWSIETEILRTPKIASDNDFAFLPLPGGVIKAVGIKNKATIWQSEIGGEIASSILQSGDSLFVVSANEFKQVPKSIVTKISATTGITQWRKEFAWISNNIYLYERGANLYVLTDRGQMIVLEKNNGNLIDSTALSAEIAFPAVLDDSRAYVADKNGKIIRASFAGSERFGRSEEIYTIANSPTSMVFADQSLYVGDDLGKVYKLNILNVPVKKSDWTFRTGGRITDISEAENNLLISSADNYVYYVSKKNGNLIWKKRLPGKSQGQILVRGNIAVFTPLGEQTAVFVELKKGKTVNQVKLDSNNENFFISSPIFSGNVLIFSTLLGFYAYSSDGCT